MSDTVLKIENLVAGYVKGMPILNDVNLTLKKGTIVVIIGPNGAGKSTLIKAIAGIVPITSGSVTLGSKNITGLAPHTMTKEKISYVPQSDNIFRMLSIRENLELVLRASTEDTTSRLDELFEQFPILAEKQKQKGGSLSGGQRQLLAVAMALSTRPEIILMDEPSAGLSPKATQEVLELVRNITKTGVSVLLVEQNVKQALRLADHCYILAEGRNQLDGPAAELLNDPVVGEIYLGGKRIVAS
ncbi:MAG: ABC-type branched-subunit amino acid transport system ATPase component [Enterobacterales bacterium]|jgi:ABC-type branched-subunit amino acid transport system ATPase component